MEHKSYLRDTLLTLLPRIEPTSLVTLKLPDRRMFRNCHSSTLTTVDEKGRSYNNTHFYAYIKACNKKKK